MYHGIFNYFQILKTVVKAINLVINGRTKIASKSEFLEWKQNKVTQEVMLSLLQRVNDLKEELAAQAGLDSQSDRFKAGAIAAYNDLIRITHEEIELD